jgi:Probable Zinc-ribbon domain
MPKSREHCGRLSPLNQLREPARSRGPEARLAAPIAGTRTWGTSIAIRHGPGSAPMQLPSSRTGSKYWIDGFPELVREWDANRNGAIQPSDLSAGSGRLVWWICPHGPDHRWRAKPNNRTRGSGCPFCTNRRVSLTNNLVTRFPEIASQWHPTQNGATRPSEVVATSSRVAWWLCPQDARHTWRASVRDRTRDQSACPFCSNDRVCESNNLRELHPVVAAEWHPTRNAPLAPERVTPGSSRRVWWLCSACNHEWQAIVANRVSRASLCPACAGHGRIHANSSRPDDSASRREVQDKVTNRPTNP